MFLRNLIRAFLLPSMLMSLCTGGWADPPSDLPSEQSSKGKPPPPSSFLDSGPLVGWSGHYEVQLWVKTTQSAQVQFRYWPHDQPDQKKESKVYSTSSEHHFIVQPILTNLKPATHYSFEVLINQKVISRPYPLKFQTQVRWLRKQPPPDFSFAIGSCSYINLHPDDTYGGQIEIFERIRQTQPDGMIWMGDHLYLGAEDYSSSVGIFRKYAQYRRVAELQSLFGSVHHYATWDDHDYGPNDSNWSYPLKGESLKAFKAYWPNPNFGLPELAGNFGTFSWGDADFFLLDNRSYRGMKRADGSLSYLGDRQLDWLLSALTQSRATFKIVVSGSQVLSPYHRFESYAQHPQELKELLQGLKDRQIQGVVFLSGDRHHSELNLLNDDPHFYPLYDFTSSPLTSRAASSANQEANNPRRVPNTFVVERNYGMLYFSGPENNRSLKLETRNVQGHILWTHTIQANHLKIPNLKH